MKRIFTLVVALVMVLSVAPLAVSAADLDATAHVWYGVGTKDSYELTAADTLANAIKYASDNAGTPVYIQVQNDIAFTASQKIGTTKSSTTKHGA